MTSVIVLSDHYCRGGDNWYEDCVNCWNRYKFESEMETEL